MPTKTWAVTEAKAKLSHLVDAALRGEPQIITHHGKRAGSLVDFFARSPHRDIEIAAPRTQASGRKIDL